MNAGAQMGTGILTLLILVSALSVGSAGAQHEGHQMPGQTATPGTPLDPVAQIATTCAQSQQQASAIAAQVSRRLEAGRQADSPGDLRTAMDDLQAALNQMRAVSQACGPLKTAVATAQPAVLDQQLVNACVQSQQQVAMVADRLNRRLEIARQTNGAPQMRAAVDDVQTALEEVGASLRKCDPLRAAVTSAAPMDHSKMPMGVAPPAGKPEAASAAKPTAPAVPMDHSMMKMGGGAPDSKPAAAKPTARASPMDHSMMSMGGGTLPKGNDHGAMKMDKPKLPVMPAERIADPACPNSVSQPTAPRATYQRKVYYFCSTADRDGFRMDPAAYLKTHPR